MLTIGEALALDVLTDTRIVAGKNGLERKITWVNILEVLDEIDLLQEGELLITTAFGLKDNNEMVANLIPELAKRRLAGLAIQTGYYLEQIPEIFIEQANRFSLPLLELPKHVAFTNVTKAILRRVVDLQIELLEYTERLSKEFTQIVLDNQGLSEVCKVLNKLCGLPVQIYDRFLDLQISTDSQAASAFEKLPQYNFAKLARKEAQLLHSHHAPRYFEGTVDCPGRLIAPVMAGNKVYGYICVVVGDNPPKEHLIISVSQAATVTALIILKENAVIETEQRMRGDFLDDLLSGNFPLGEAFFKKAQALGFDLTKKHGVFIIDIDSFSEYSLKHSEQEIQKLRQKLLETVQRVMTLKGLQTVIKIKNNDLLVLLQLSPDQKSTLYKGLLTDLKDQITLLHGITVSIGGGRLYGDLTLIPTSYNEALSAITVTKNVWRKNSVGLYEDLGIYRFLMTSHPDERHALYWETVAPLIEKDRRNSSDLIYTAEIYLKNNCNIQESSRELFIHRHTLRYRLQKIQEITNLDLTKPEDRLRLQLGLLTRHITDND